MTPSQEHDADTPEAGSEGADIQRRVDEIEGNLWDGLAGDRRLDSGVPAQHRGSDLEFIRMTGLTRQRPKSGSADELVVPPADDADPRRPVSFFEKGVSDVDAAMAPPSLDNGAEPDQDIYSERLEPPSIAGLRGIIADLTAEPSPQTPVSPPEPVSVPAPSGAAAGPAREAWSFPGATEPSDLLEAEQLLQALQDQPRDDYLTGSTMSTPTPTPQPAPRRPSDPAPFTPPEPEPPPESLNAPVQAPTPEDGPAYEQESSPYRRHSRGRKRRRQRRLIRWSVRGAAFLLLFCGGIAGYWWVEPRLLAPEKTFVEAEALVAKGRYEEASRFYLTFSRLQPNHRERPAAEFNAAYVLLLEKPATPDESRRVWQQALDLLERFARNNPNHVKTVRAQILMGVLNYQLGRYQEAVALLRHPDLRLRDADAALPALRTMARAYAKLGEYDAAESMYLQAASLPGNYSADVDYHELGDLFQTRAEAALDQEERIALQRSAITYWAHAMREPGIDPVNRARIKEKHDWLLSEMPQSEQEDLVSGKNEAPTNIEERSPAAGSALDAAGSLPQQKAATDDASDKSVSAVDIEPNPAVEAKFLAGQSAPASAAASTPETAPGGADTSPVAASESPEDASTVIPVAVAVPERASSATPPDTPAPAGAE